MTQLDNAVHPYRINVPEEALVDLRRRIAATRWPDKETVDDGSQGSQLAKVQGLVRYWGTDHRRHRSQFASRSPAGLCPSCGRCRRLLIGVSLRWPRNATALRSACPP
jgi:hypothetical protein